MQTPFDSDTFSNGNKSETDFNNYFQNLSKGILQETSQIFFGDEICLKSDSIESLQYMHSDGFYPSCLKYVDFSKVEKQQLDIEGAVLEICHPGMFAISKTQSQKNQGFFSSLMQQSSLQQILPFQQNLKNNHKGSTANSYHQEIGSGMINTSQEEIEASQNNDKQYEMRIKQEKEDNQEDNTKGNEYDKTDNRTPLTFHQSFILKHKRSQKYLGLVEDDLEHFSLILSSSPSLFKISPCFKSQQVKSRNVCYSQYIFIQSAPFGTSVTKDAFLALEEFGQVDGNMNEHEEMYTASKFSKYSSFFGDFFFSPNSKTNFYFERYRSTSDKLQEKEEINESGQQSSLSLSFGDVIKIFHIETDSYLQYQDQTLEQFKANYSADESYQEKASGSISGSSFQLNIKTLLFKKNAQQAHHITDEVFFCKSSQQSIFNDSDTLWKVINPLNILDGRKVDWNEKIVLKCLNKQQFLHINEDEDNKQLYGKLKDNISDLSGCQFYLSEDTFISQSDKQMEERARIEQVKYSRLFRLVHDQTGFTLSTNYQNNVVLEEKAKQDKEIIQQKKQQNLTQSVTFGNFMPKVKNQKKKQKQSEEKQLDDEERGMILKEVHCPGDVIKFISVDKGELIENNYITSSIDIIQSAIPLIHRYVMLNESKEKDKSFQFTNPYFMEFTELLKLSLQHLIKFILNINSSERIKYDESIFRRHKVDQEKQDFASKRGILEYSVILLKAIWSHEDESRIQEILQITGRGEEIEFEGRLDAKDQSGSQSFTLGSVTLKRRSTQLNHIGYSIGATKAISFILKNNEKLLASIHLRSYSKTLEAKEQFASTFNKQHYQLQKLKGNGSTKIKNTIIHIFFKKYLQMFENSGRYWNNFLDVMNIMCICKDQALNINQLMIGHELLSKTDIKAYEEAQKAFIHLRCKEDVIIIKVFEKEIELSDFVRAEKEQQKNNNKTPSMTYSFLLKQLELFSNLCVERNYQNKALLENDITVTALIKYITNEDLTKELRANLLAILINLHFDSYPRKKIKKPCYTKFMYLNAKSASQTNEQNGNESKQRESESEESGDDESFGSIDFKNPPLRQHLANEKSIEMSNTNEEFPENRQPSRSTPSIAHSNDQDDKEINLRNSSSQHYAHNNENDEHKVSERPDQVTAGQLSTMQKFVVNYLREQIFSKEGLLQCDMLSYNVVRLARLMIQFNCFHKSEPEFIQVIESLMVILQTEHKGSLTEKLKKVYEKNPVALKNREEKEKCRLMIHQEVLLSLLYYQSFIVDGNLKGMLEFISKVLSSDNFFSVGNKMDQNLHIQSFIKNNLISYLPKLNATKPKLQYDHRNSSGEYSETSSLTENRGTFLPNKETEDKNSKPLSNFHSNRKIFKTFDDIAKGNSFFYLILKNFVSIGTSDFKTGHLILKILFSYFSQRQNTIRAIKRIQIITTEGERQLFKFTKYLSVRVAFISEMQELWMKGDNPLQQTLHFKEIDQIMQQINLIFYEEVKYQKEQKCLISKKPKQLLNKVGKVSFRRQHMMRNLEVYKSILKIISEGNIMLADIKKESDQGVLKAIQLNQEMKSLFSHCYNFLNLFVKGNCDNQKVLSNYLDLFLRNAGETDYGQYKLLSEIIKQNKKICKNLSTDLIQLYLKKVYSQESTQLYLLDVLSFFENMICDMDDPSYQNIDKFINCLFDSNEFVNFFALKQTAEDLWKLEDIFDLKHKSNGKPQSTIFLQNTFEFDCQQEVLEVLGRVNQQYIIPETKIIEDLPFVYQRKAIQIANIVLKNSINPTNFRYLFSKLLTIDYMYQLLSLDDVFSIVNIPSILIHNFKPVLMEFIKLVWLGNEKNSSKLNKNKFMIAFLYKEASKFKNVSSEILQQLKFTMNSSTPKEKYNTILSVGKDMETGGDYNIVSQNSQEFRPSLNADYLLKLSMDEEESKENQYLSQAIKEKESSSKPQNFQHPPQIQEFETLPPTIHPLILQLDTDYIVYLFKHLVPFIIDTFKCFIGYDSQQASFNARSDFEAFQAFARELAAFCEYKMDQEFLQKEGGWVLGVLIEVQELFKIKIQFAFNIEQEARKYELKQQANFKNSQPLRQATKIDEKATRLINDSRISRIIEPLYEDHSQDSFTYKCNSEVAQVTLHLLNSQYVKEEIIRKERHHLIKALREGGRSNSLSMINIMKNLVNFVKNAVDNLEREEGMANKEDRVLADTIQLLSDILSSYTRQEEKTYMQTFLNQNGIVKIVVKFFCLKSNNIRLFQSFLIFSINLISTDQGANSEIQESFYSSIISQGANENLFCKIADLIKQEIHFQTFHQEQISRKMESECKSLTFSYSLDDKFEFQQLLKFIQLLVTNSFSKLQKYLHSQPKTSQNYDILLLLVDLVESYVNGYISKTAEGQKEFITDSITCEKAVMTLQTIIICIQGPCVENQIELAQSKFFDICYNLLRLDDSYEQFQKLERILRSTTSIEFKSQQNIFKQSNSSKDKSHFKEILTQKQKRLIEDAYKISPLYSQVLSTRFHLNNPLNYGVWMLSSIKHKCISCLESLMDGENKFIIKRMIATIPPSILKTNLGWVYEKYVAFYLDKEHFDYDLFEIKEIKTIAQQLQKLDIDGKLILSLKSSLIIDSGFVIFKLLRYMFNHLNNNEVEIIYSKIAKHQAEKLKKQSNKNIFYQLVSLSKDFYKIFQSFIEFLKTTENLALRVRKNKADFNAERMKARAINFFSKYSASIEIVQNDKIIKVSFPKYPHCFSLTNSLKYKVTDRINIYSPHSKVESLVKLATPFIERLKFEQKFKARLENSNMIAILANNLDLWKNLSYFVCVLQNLVVLLTQQRSQGQSFFSFEFIGKDNQFQLTLQIIQISLASLVFFFFLLKKVPLINKKTQDMITQIEKNKFSIDEQSMSQNSIQANSQSYAFLEFKLKTWLFLNDVELIYFLIYFTLALIGMFNVFFLALLLFDIFWRFPALWNVLHAVWRPRRSILLTIFLFLIFTYLFTLTAYYFFLDRFDHLCDNLITCFSVIFDYMYKADGGITSKFAPDGPSNFIDYYGLDYKLNWKSLWDFLYFFVIITLLFEIISGIIIDTFGLLRDEEDERKKNKRDFCLICSIDRATIDKLSSFNQGYQHHIDVEHNMWNYIFFISYLQEKDKNSFLGIEQEIYEKLQKKDISWFPLNRSLSLCDLSDQNEEVENISKKINSLEKKFSLALDLLLKGSKQTDTKIKKIDNATMQQKIQLQNQGKKSMYNSISMSPYKRNKSFKFERSSSTVLNTVEENEGSSKLRRVQSVFEEEDDEKPLFNKQASMTYFQQK